MARYTRVFLDADDTVFDFGASEHFSLHQVMAAFSLPFPEEAERYYLAVNAALWKQYEQGGISQDALCVKRFEMLLTYLQRDTAPAAKLNAAYAEALSCSSVLLPGALDFCRRAAVCFPLYLLTNGVAFIQQRRVALSPIRPYLSGVFVSQQVGWQKPQKEFFGAVFRTLGMTEADKRQAVMIGDSLHSDILGGRNAGLDTVWLNMRGASADESIRPTYTAHSFEELTELLGCGQPFSETGA